jgi:RNA polymerase subunit RPABC4/transcription elongation factor Spt4
VSEDSHSSTKDRVKALLLEGLSVTEIARRLGVSKPTVCFHKRTLGIEIDSKFGRRYDWGEIREYYDSGHSMRECLALELHHVNGDGRDNRIENLMLLCPNCHSQTDNWGGRAKGLVA